MAKVTGVIFSILFISCAHLMNPSKEGLNYHQWDVAIDNALKFELKDLCQYWPETEGKCIDEINFYRPYFRAVNVAYNVALLDSILNINHISHKQNLKIFIEESYLDGFNAWHCTRILVHDHQKNKDFGLKSCKTSIEREPFKIEQETPQIENIDVDVRYMSKAFKEKSAKFSRNAIIAITELDKNYNIKRCRTVLLP